ncbi:MAG: hypothetical protein JO288_06250 [Hyphomicrobiales bacterium]|nr:hypothetical protein [Hyphomicrobiales bacterium]
MMRSAVLMGALAVASALGGCYSAGYPACYTVCTAPYPPAYPAHPPLPTAWDDPFADYSQRILTVSPSAGNAQAANLALQTATPWPRHSSNTNIPADGARAVKAIQNYEGRTSPSLPPPGAGEGGNGGGGSGEGVAAGGGGGGGRAAGGGSGG